MSDETRNTFFELRVECQKLPKLDFFSESDPVVILSLRNDTRQITWLEFGRTEVIQDSPNPRFTKCFILGGKETHLRFDVFDIDSDSDNMDEHDYIGFLETNLQDILWAKNKTLSEHLINPERDFSGTITLMVDEIVDTPENITFQFAVQNIEAQANSLFFEINRRRKDGHLAVVYRSKPCPKSSNIIWDPFNISLGTLCYGDSYQDFVVEIFSFNKSGDHTSIGTAKSSIIELKNITDATSRFLDIVGEWKEDETESTGYLFVKEMAMRP
ncbi:hypothetical protein K7432_005677 [Basidiobolus ranarum]|uniref:C2 domain-containing protein n=1 Tax=Basidiobolus ranarum TaxID=34480 RepID=A0ABR2WW92_9FUNG